MKGTISAIFLVGFLIACLLVDDSCQLAGILKSSIRNRKGPSRQGSNERPEASKPNVQKKPPRKPYIQTTYPERRPDRYPEGPMFDQRREQRFNYFWKQVGAKTTERTSRTRCHFSVFFSRIFKKIDTAETFIVLFFPIKVNTVISTERD